MARPPERAQEFCAFPLTLTYIDVAGTEVTPFWCYFLVGGQNEAAGAAAATALAFD